MTQASWRRLGRHDREPGKADKIQLRQVFDLRRATQGFFADGALTHAAAMAFYAATSLVPILLIVVSVAGLAPLTCR